MTLTKEELQKRLELCEEGTILRLTDFEEDVPVDYEVDVHDLLAEIIELRDEVSDSRMKILSYEDFLRKLNHKVFTPLSTAEIKKE